MANNFTSIFKLRNLLAAIAMIICTFSNINSQILIVENFNYPQQDSVLELGNWYRTGSASANMVKLVYPGLSYAGYKSSDIGSSTLSTNVADGQGIIRIFEKQTTGTVYTALMLRVKNLPASTTEGFFFNLDQHGSTTNFCNKLYLKRLSSTTFNLGLKKQLGSTKYSSTVFNANTTYLVVLTYTFNNSGDSNDVANLYVFNSGIPGTQPVSPLVSDNEGMDVTDIGDVVITNSFIQSTMTGTDILIDGLRIAKSWNSLFNDNINVTLDMQAYIQGFTNEVTNMMVKDTMKVVLRYTAAPYSIADSSKAIVDSMGKGMFLFNKIGLNSEYYLVVSHRNTIDTWSSVPGEVTSNFTMDYYFFYLAGNAYGSNQVNVGSRYCMYNGDANRDNVVNLADVVAVNNNTTSFATGYLKTDMNGDNITNLTDLVLTFNNASNFVGTIKP